MNSKSSTIKPFDIKNQLEEIAKSVNEDPKGQLLILKDLISNTNKEEQVDNYLLATAYKSECEWYLGLLDDTFYSSVELLEFAEEHENEEYRAIALNNMGSIYGEWENIEIAIGYLEQALTSAEKDENLRQQCNILNNIATCYFQSDKGTALKYYEASYKIAVDIKKTKNASVALFNIAELNILQNDYDSALEKLNCGLELAIELSDYNLMGYGQRLLSKIQLKRNLMDSAKAYIGLSVDTYSKMNLNTEVLASKLLMADILVENKEYEKALFLLHTVLSESKKLDNKKYTVESLGKITEIYERNGNVEKAYAAYKKYLRSKLEYEDYKARITIDHFKTKSKVDLWKNERGNLKNKNRELDNKNKALNKLMANTNFISEIGKQITATLNLEEIFKLIYKNINDAMDASFLALCTYDSKNGVIDFPYVMESSSHINISSLSVENRNSIFAWSIKNSESILIGDYSKSYSDYIENYIECSFGDTIKSIIVCPLVMNNEVIGAISIQSRKVGEYGEYELKIIKALSAFVSIALKNSQKSERLANEVGKRMKVEGDLREANLSLSKMVHIDELTKIYNRRWLMDYSTTGFIDATKNGDEIALMILDVDKFKEYNDNYGHIAGDACLNKVAKAISGCLNNESEHAVRYGGDEFIVVIENTNESYIRKLTHDLCSSIRSLNIEHVYSPVYDNLTITVGAFVGKHNGKSNFENFMKYADQSLYVAKAYGRNRAIINQSFVSNYKNMKQIGNS